MDWLTGHQIWRRKKLQPMVYFASELTGYVLEVRTYVSGPIEPSVEVADGGPPQIAGASLTRQQGSTPHNSTIATVNDVETPAGALNVMVTSVPPGISIDSLVNNNGIVTANIGASCAAALGINTIGLKVTDGDGMTATTNLLVNVVANTAPVLGVYPSVTVALGGGRLVILDAPPSDNGAVINYSVSAPGLAVGVITLANLLPAGQSVNVEFLLGVMRSGGHRFFVNVETLP